MKPESAEDILRRLWKNRDAALTPEALANEESAIRHALAIVDKSILTLPVYWEDSTRTFHVQLPDDAADCKVTLSPLPHPQQRHTPTARPARSDRARSPRRPPPLPSGAPCAHMRRTATQGHCNPRTRPRREATPHEPS